jgi:5-methylcytosine-specific restriction enzyme A
MAWPTTSRHERGYGTAHDKMRKHLMSTVITCEECTRHGRTAIGTIADHVIPLSRGGTGERSNYQLLCKPCSDAKTNAEAGRQAIEAKGIGRNGRPTSADHAWNR